MLHASPVFAALVLHDILSKIQPELENRAAQRKAAGDLGDNGLGSTGFSLAYVDDVNAVLHHQDVDFFLRRFKVLGKPLGAILNTEKTRNMLSCRTAEASPQQRGSFIGTTIRIHHQRFLNNQGQWTISTC